MTVFCNIVLHQGETGHLEIAMSIGDHQALKEYVSSQYSDEEQVTAFILRKTMEEFEQKAKEFVEHMTDYVERIAP